MHLKNVFFNSNILKIKLSCGSVLAANHHTSQKQRALNYCSHQIVFLLIRFGFSLILFCIFADSIRHVLQLYCSIPWFNLIYIICYPWISICALPLIVGCCMLLIWTLHMIRTWHYSIRILCVRIAISFYPYHVCVLLWVRC